MKTLLKKAGISILIAGLMAVAQEGLKQLATITQSPELWEKKVAAPEEKVAAIEEVVE